ncbi:ROK family transcriptional regulator [Mesorhizobium sp. WSM3224]|uniref:ROK family transcriptional regulator n=1 Tax=Mesorhizobium sp. WSM3224 TaxID=1040986 RepID=UPI000688BDFF|nr:ROK family transcriptional regulator [Mesorhizobium sp. WSM3224]
MTIAQQIVPPRVARQLTQRKIFEALLLQGPISRADLAKVTGLSKQTTSEVVDKFEQQGLVRSVGRTSGNVGRTAVLYELSPDGGYCLGVDLGGTKLSAVIADISGKVLAEVTEPTDQRGGTVVLDQITRLTLRLARDLGIHPSRIRSSTIGTPGVVNPKSGAVELAPNIAHLGEVDVISTLSERLGGLVTVDNDVNLGLLGEMWHGCAQNVANVAFVALGTGLGLGLCANGQLVRGDNGAAGEIGYFPIGGDPWRSSVREQGCLEYEAGAAGIVRRYRQAGGAEVDGVRAIFDRMNNGEKLAAQTIDDTARLIAQAVAIVAVTADPKLVVLGGSIGARADFTEKVSAELSRLTPRVVEILPSALGNRASVVGALAVALNRLHEDLFGVAELPGALPLPAPKSGKERIPV